MKLPTDKVSNHIIFEVHSYLDVKNLSNAKSEASQMMRDLKNNLVAKGAPVIFGEWGTSGVDAGDYDNYRSNVLAYARYFVEQAKANNMGTFYWMGLSDGNSRSVPEFNQADLKDAIIKGYYGDEGYSGISFPQSPESAEATFYYDLQGHRHAVPRKGLNIVRRNNRITKIYL